MTAVAEIVAKGFSHVLLGLSTTGRSDSYVTMTAGLLFF